MEFRTAFEEVVAGHSSLEQTVHRMSLEQDNLDTQIKAIEATVDKLLEREEAKDPSQQNSALVDNCLKIFEQLRGHESDLTKIIDDLNRDIVGRGSDEADDGATLNLAINNFYNAISSIELQLAGVQLSLNSFR